MKWKASLAALCLGATHTLSYGPAQLSHIIRVLGPQGVNLWKLDHPKSFDGGRTAPDFFVQDSQSQVGLGFEDKDKSLGDHGFRAQWFQQPLDHFDNKSQHVFSQRYWVNSRHYKPRKGAPVIVLDGGETSGEVCPTHLLFYVYHSTVSFQDRLPFLDTGIVEILARATGGVGIVLEHRYYGTYCNLVVNWSLNFYLCTGKSLPVSNLSTDALRYDFNVYSINEWPFVTF